MTSRTPKVAIVLALAVAVMALAAPAAPARHADEYFQANTAIAQPSPAPPPPSSAPPTVSGDGFDWGDAGIGATAVLALTAIAVGTAITLRHRPSRGSLA